MDLTITRAQTTVRLDDVLVRFLASEETELPDNFAGKLGETLVEPAPVGSGAQFLLTVGLGPAPAMDMEILREATGAALAQARSLKVTSIALEVPRFNNRTVKRPIGQQLSDHEIGQAMAEAALLFGYTYDAFKKQSEARTRLATCTFLVDRRNEAQVAKGVARAEQLIEGVTLTRNLVNTPADRMHPEELVVVAKKIAKESGGAITATILDEAACAKLGMEAYLAVGKGSEFPSKFIHLAYTPAKPAKKTVALVGKGVTFDSGGLSLKPADSMMTMKCDMAGAASVLGVFSVLAEAAPKVTVHGIIAAAENMPSGKAMRPGDVVTASNGTTIEILNTDAEGRLILADALTYAVKLEPDVIVDIATLTGACVVALGEEVAGVMSNDDDTAVALLAAADRTGEKLWELPLHARYRSLIESDVADLRNIATSRYGGTLTAGLFLKEFVADVPWAHLDIAGPAFAERPMSSYLSKGGTGFIVRTLLEFVEKF